MTTSVSYNILNLPSEVKFDDGHIFEQSATNNHSRRSGYDVELNTRKEMKKITIVLVLFFLNIGNSFCQKSGKFLVFTFNCVYEIGEYKHGTGDNLWIIPYDSCLTNFSDRKLTPLFADDYLINSLSDSITNNQT